jgi:hypothetical protein
MPPPSDPAAAAALAAAPRAMYVVRSSDAWNETHVIVDDPSVPSSIDPKPPHSPTTVSTHPAEQFELLLKRTLAVPPATGLNAHTAPAGWLLRPSSIEVSGFLAHVGDFDLRAGAVSFALLSRLVPFGFTTAPTLFLHSIAFSPAAVHLARLIFSPSVCLCVTPPPESSELLISGTNNSTCRSASKGEPAKTPT